jgi:hypothetical protein
MVAFYTRTPTGWTLAGGTPVPIRSGTWVVTTVFGTAYAAVLGRTPFNPEPSLQALPQPGNSIIDVKIRK